MSVFTHYLPDPWQQSGMKWVAHCVRQVRGAFSPHEVNFLLLAAFTEFILNHVSLAVYSHYHYLKMQVFFLLHFVNVRMQ